MSTTSEPRLVTGTREGRYGEVLLVKLDEGVSVEVYNSYMLNDCPQDAWDALDAEALAAEHGATFAILNGPRYWMMDGIGKVDNVDRTLATFGGIEMFKVATIIIEGSLERETYSERTINRGSIWFFDAGKDVYELVSPEGKVYILQAYCTGVDPTMSVASLASLGERLSLPEGWSYRTRVLDEELVIDTTGHYATVIQDDFENTYTLVA